MNEEERKLVYIDKVLEYKNGIDKGKLQERENLKMIIDNIHTYDINRILFDNGFRNETLCFTMKGKVKENISSKEILDIHIGFNLALKFIREELKKEVDKK